MTFLIALRRLLPLLAVLSLALAPVTASAAAAGMRASMVAQGHAVAVPAGGMDDMAGMAMEEMPCCPHEGSGTPDCSKGCPLMALCLAKVASGLPSGIGVPMRIAVAFTECSVWGGDASFSSLAQAPPSEPPRS